MTKTKRQQKRPKRMTNGHGLENNSSWLFFNFYLWLVKFAKQLAKGILNQCCFLTRTADLEEVKLTLLHRFDFTFIFWAVYINLDNHTDKVYCCLMLLVSHSVFRVPFLFVYCRRNREVIQREPQSRGQRARAQVQRQGGRARQRPREGA